MCVLSVLFVARAELFPAEVEEDEYNELADYEDLEGNVEEQVRRS